MVIRFKSLFSTPLSGCYEYGLDGAVVSDRYKSGICAKVRNLRASKGLQTAGDGFAYVMEYMCPSMPDGFCTAPSKVRYLQAEEVKARTMTLFPLPCATVDVISRRPSVCALLPKPYSRVLPVLYRPVADLSRYGGRRPACPADSATGARACDRMLTAAVATAASFPLTPDVEYPAECWRLKEKDSADG